MGIPEISFSQKEFNNWIFGNGTGFTFNDYNGLPRVFGDDEVSQLYEPLIYYKSTPVSVSDRDGNLLFYSDVKHVFNRNHEIMANGDLFSYNCSMIAIPMKRRKNSYYLFYQRQSSLYYAIVDMTKNNGLGEVVEKDVIIKLLNYSYCYVNRKIFASAKLTNNNYCLYFFEERLSYYYNTINRIMIENDKISILDGENSYSNENFAATSFLAVSPDATKLLYHPESTKLFILHLNPNTGEIISLENLNEKKKINLDVCVRLHCAAFSPDGKKLYFSATTELYNRVDYIQYDFESKEFTVLTNSYSLFPSCFRLGPDGKIYIASSLMPEARYISVIHEPNVKGIGCNLEINAIDLGEGKGSYIFPHYTGYGMFYDAYANTPICGGEDLDLYAVIPQYSDSCTVEWLGPRGFISNEINPKIYNVNSSHSGAYTLKISTANDEFIKTLNIQIEDLPKARIHPSKDTLLCKGNTYRLRAFPRELEESYLWSNGSTEHEIFVTETGEYVLTAMNEIGCTISDTVFVRFVEPTAEIVGKPRICRGDETELAAEPIEEIYKYKWSTGETTPTITIKEPGNYTVEITYTDKCSAIASILVREYLKPKAQIMIDGNICDGDEIRLYSFEQRHDYKYNWSTGESTSEIRTSASGTIHLIVENANGCKDTAQITLAPRADAEIAGELCITNTTKLRVKNYNPSVSYNWSTGERSEEITISVAGKYKLYAENAIGCKDSSIIEVFDNPSPVILGNNQICPNSTIILSADKDYTKYLWSNGEESKSIEVNTYGNYTLSVTDENGCEATAEHKVELIDFELTYPHTIEVNTKTYQEKIIRISIKNIGKERIVISRITTNSELFKINNSINSLEIGEEQEIELSFRSNALGIFTAELTIETSSPCVQKYEVGLRVEVEQGLQAKVRLPRLKATPGEMLRIPLYAQFSESIDTKLNYEATILINEDILWLESEKQGNKLKITMSGEANISEEEEEIGEINGMVLFGDSPSALEIAEIRWSDSGIETGREDGEIEIDGICSPGLRNIKIFEPISISGVIRGGQIEFQYKNLDGNEYEVKLYDLIGKQVLSIKRNLKGNGQTELPTQDIPQGIYLYTVSTQGILIKTGKISLVK